MGAMDIAPLFMKAVEKVEFYWQFYVVTLVGMTGWLVAAKPPLTGRLRLLLTGGYLIFVAMNLAGLRNAYAFAEGLRLDLLGAAKEDPAGLTHSRAALEAQSFADQRRHAGVIHAILGILVLAVVWFAPPGEE
jgi:hypothetical protein